MTDSASKISSSSGADTGDKWDNEDIIQLNQFLLIKMPSGNAKVIQMKPNLIIDLGKFGKFNSDSLIGQYYECTYEIGSDQLCKLVDSSKFLDALELESSADANNQDIFDDGTSQKLSHDQIEKLKADSLEGKVDSDTIIKSLVENNASFAKKTEFAKAKYIQRKQRKFAKIVRPIRLTSRVMCEHFFEKNPAKIRDLRVDTLSQLLTLSNARSGSRLLVVDETAGLVTAALLERLGGKGKLFCLHDKMSPNLDCLRVSNMSTEMKSCVAPIPWYQITTDYEPILEVKENDSDAFKERQNIKFAKKMSDLTEFKAGNFDGLILATKFNPKEVIDKLLPYIGYSGTLVVYDPRKEVLLEAYDQVRFSKQFIYTHLSESWLREYKIPSSSAGTHPHMMTSGSGGYYFSAKFVKDVENENYQSVSAERYRNKKAKKEGGNGNNQ